MNRREIIAGLAVAAATPLSAQGSRKKVGFVDWFPASWADRRADNLRKGLRDLGYTDSNLQIEAYPTAGSRERTREVLDKLIRDGVDVLVVAATPAIAIAKEAANGKVPIVMAPVSDPIAAGFVQSLSRPGGNLTGLSMFGPNLAAKRMEFLKEMRPGLRKVAFLGSRADVNAATFIRGTQAEADRNGLTLNVHMVDGPGAIEEATFEAMRRDGSEAVIVQPIFTGFQDRIVDLATKAGLPAISDYAVFAEAGAVLTYGIDDTAQLRRAAHFVDRILRGANPGDLPIEQPTQFKLVINAAAAKNFGWTIPPSLLAQVDEVIE